jgi:Protein of unknown function (DUF2442)
MLKISHINLLEDYTILCTFNNGITKAIDIMPLLEKHKHLSGIEKLKEKNVFSNARIGMFGEIVWDKIIRFSNSGKDEMWDYDISPEFVFYNGVNS